MRGEIGYFGTFPTFLVQNVSSCACYNICLAYDVFFLLPNNIPERRKTMLCSLLDVKRPHKNVFILLRHLQVYNFFFLFSPLVIEIKMRNKVAYSYICIYLHVYLFI